MDRKRFLQLSGLLLPLLFIGCGTKPEAEAPKEETPKKDKLTFAFLTDVHLSRDNRGEGNDGLAGPLKIPKPGKPTSSSSEVTTWRRTT